MSNTFKPLRIGNLEFPNRIIMPPMCMYQAEPDGFITLFHMTHYLTRAIGGVGGIIVEATGIEERGRITENDLGLWNDSQATKLSELTKAIHQYHTKIGIQLNHAGRKSNTSGEIIAPSAIAYYDGKIPFGMTEADIQNTITLWQNAAKRAKDAGFDFLEIHAAHGYLINEFLSPLTNHRTDRYGGNPENRSRFLREVIAAVRKVWPKDRVLGVRVSAEEYDAAGNHPETLGEIINLVKKEGIDFVDVSSGGVLPVRVKDYPGYQLEFAKTIRKLTGLTVIGGGLITSFDMMEFALSECCDLVFTGRELLRNPYFPLQAASIMHEEIEWPKPYERGKKS